MPHTAYHDPNGTGAEASAVLAATPGGTPPWWFPRQPIAVAAGGFGLPKDREDGRSREMVEQDVADIHGASGRRAQDEYPVFEQYLWRFGCSVLRAQQHLWYTGWYTGDGVVKNSLVASPFLSEI